MTSPVRVVYMTWDSKSKRRILQDSAKKKRRIPWDSVGFRLKKKWDSKNESWDSSGIL